MNAHAHRPLTRRPSSPKPLGRFAAWVNTKWRARRARRLEEETMACLSAMDAKLLNDIGMDIGKLGDLADEPAPANPVTAFPPSQHSNRHKRS
ncbi:hypothetical protein [Taklimakanibacter deserti]|uniref:hypothetical protein n=1 Tax=Taklimakanibacter deserti TaxID=2267839 RepID=UPI0013C425EB